MRNPQMSSQPLTSERGVALIIALLIMMLMSALGLALVLTTTTETRIVGNFRGGQEALYAADAILERAIDDLLTVPDWNTILAGSTTSAFIDGTASGVRTLADGGTLNLTELVNVVNCGKASGCSDADLTAATSERPWGANNPRWQLYAYGPLSDIVPTDTINSPFYVVLLVGDDPSENDDDPLHDGASQANPGTGVLSLRAEAYGPMNARKVIEVTVARTDTTQLERGYTGQRGEDEQNRRARKAAVQTPGKSLTRMEMTLSLGGLQ